MGKDQDGQAVLLMMMLPGTILPGYRYRGTGYAAFYYRYYYYNCTSQTSQLAIVVLILLLLLVLVLLVPSGFSPQCTRPLELRKHLLLNTATRLLTAGIRADSKKQRRDWACCSGLLPTLQQGGGRREEEGTVRDRGICKSKRMKQIK